MDAEEEHAGKRLALWRRQQRPRITQAQAAAALGVTQETVSRVENGHIVPSPHLANAIDPLLTGHQSRAIYAYLRVRSGAVHEVAARYADLLKRR